MIRYDVDRIEKPISARQPPIGVGDRTIAGLRNNGRYMNIIPIMLLKHMQPGVTRQGYIVNSKWSIKHAIGTLRQ